MPDPVLVFAPAPLITVTIEDRGGEPDLHVHAGGQGIWQARTISSLGVPVVLCAALGGETGAVLRHLIAAEGVEVDAEPAGARNGGYVHDRRDGSGDPSSRPLARRWAAMSWMGCMSVRWAPVAARPWQLWQNEWNYARGRSGTDLPARRRALVTNDDGIDSPGLAVLVAAAVQAGLEVVVAAPRWQSSGASAGIIATVREGRTLIERWQLADLPGVEAYAVDAQPAYIVLAAVRGWLDPVPELVLSGINHGANVGRAILHSGTVGAALAAGVNGLHGLAVSLDVGLRSDAAPHWDSAAHLLPGVLELLTGAPRGTVLTLNVPDRPIEALRELRRATLAEFGSVQTRVDRVDNGQLHLAEVEVDTPPAAGTDSALLAAGHPTLTALESVREASDAVLPLPEHVGKKDSSAVSN